MKNEAEPYGLSIDVAGALPSVGDRESIAGSAGLSFEGVYDLLFVPGEDVAWRLDIRRIAGGLEVNGQITGAATLSCYRCLEEFEFPLSIDVREHALWLSEHELDEDDEQASEYMVTDGVLDLEPMIRDAVCLAFPARRVCDEGCGGICELCGANLNTDPCGCDTGRVDARLKPLEELKKRLEQG